jgi:hypothetical protein
LDVLIKKKQRELQQLEITLKSLQSANDEYRATIRGVSTNAETSFFYYKNYLKHNK